MTRRKCLSYSLSCAIIITSIAYLFYDAGGEYLFLPGMAVEVYLIYPIDIMISSGGRQLNIPLGNQVTFNVALYALVFYALLRLFAHTRVARENSLPDAA